jgi:hypothetical protein
MEAAETKFLVGGSFHNLAVSKLKIEKRYASVNMMIIPHEGKDLFFAYNIKFSGVSNCFKVDFRAPRAFLIPIACW